MQTKQDLFLNGKVDFQSIKFLYCSSYVFDKQNETLVRFECILSVDGGWVISPIF